MIHLAQSKCLEERPQCSLIILTIETKTSYNITSRGQGFGSEVSIIPEPNAHFLRTEFRFYDLLPIYPLKYKSDNC